MDPFPAMWEPPVAARWAFWRPNPSKAATSHGRSRGRLRPYDVLRPRGAGYFTSARITRQRPKASGSNSQKVPVTASCVQS
jgi:hypothetical protein